LTYFVTLKYLKVEQVVMTYIYGICIVYNCAVVHHSSFI